MKCTRLIKRTYLNVLTVIILLLPLSATAEQFSIVIIPDTQFYSASNPAISLSQTQWVADNMGAENIIYVSQLGDLVDSPAGCHGGATEWANVDAAMSALEGVNMAYGVLPGNHDFDPTNPVTDTCLPSRNNYNGFTGGIAGFGASRFIGRPYYGPISEQYHYDPGTMTLTQNDNNFTLFTSAGGVEFIAINLAFASSVSAEETNILDWADTLLKTYPERNAIITSHYIVGEVNAGGSCVSGGTDTSPYGSAIVDLLSENPNVFMVLSAHCRGEKWITYTKDDPERSCLGNTDLMMSNYQAFGSNDSGLMRIMRIDTDINTVDVETFSPWDGATGTPGDAASMDNNSITNFSFEHNFDEIISPSVALLVDSSGSMNWTVEGAVTADDDIRRIAFARESSLAFIDLLNSILPSPQKAQFGFVGFPNSASPGSSSAEILSELTPLTTVSRNQAASVTLPGINPNGGTPMLTGIEEAASMLESQECKNIFLLSDGYHNTPTTVSVGDVVVTDLISDLIDSQTSIYAVSLGKRETNDFELLQELATSTGGVFQDATTADFDELNNGDWDAATELSATYGKMIEELFPEVETGLDPLDSFLGGKIKTFNMPINKHDTRVSFFVSWRTPQRDLLRLKVFGSDGKRIFPKETGVKVIHGNTYTIFTVDFDVMRANIGRIGKNPWRVEMSSKRIDRGQREPIQYSVLLQSGLKFTANIGKQKYAAGDKITLTATLKKGRRPLAGLEGVKVIIGAPENGRGNWLARNQVSERQLEKVPERKDGETRAAFIRKAIYLADIAGINYPAQKAPQTLRLFDDGSHGDLIAKDGIYTNSFADTKKEGLYSFHFFAKGKINNKNKFRREKTVKSYLSIRPDPNNISIMAERISTNGNQLKKYNITVQAKDQFGNFVGPGHRGLFSLETKNGKFRGEIQDLLNGSYSHTLYIPQSTAESEVRIELKIGEVKKHIYLDQALGYEKPKTKFN